MWQFSIRDLVVLTAFIAVGAGWWSQQQKLGSANARLNQTLAATRDRLARAEDLLEYQGVVLNEDGTTYTTPDHARQLREERAARMAASTAEP